MGLRPKHTTAEAKSSEAKAAASTGLDGHCRSVRSPTGAMIGEASGAQPPVGMPVQKTGLSARRFRFDPNATKPSGDPTAIDGTTPPNAPSTSGTSRQALPSNAQAPGSSVVLFHPSTSTVDPSLARLANPKVRGSLDATSLQLMPPFENVPSQARGAPVTGLESTANRPSPMAMTRPLPEVGGAPTSTQLRPSAE